MGYRISRRGFLRLSGGMAAGVAAGGFGLAGAYAENGLAGPGGARAGTYAENGRIGLGIIGCGGMGSRHIEALCENPRCALRMLCDVAVSRFVDQGRRVEEMTGRRPEVTQDFRDVLDDPGIDAILIATPDHWHPLMTILGCQAGKDVYVEKPASTTVEEGRAMIDAARRFGRVVQVGTQQRSMPLFQEAIRRVREGAIGQPVTATAWIGTNDWGVEVVPEEVPKGLDWDMWLGPAPWEPYSPQRFGGFMGLHDYARGGQLTNWGVHLIDIIHWGIGQDLPLTLQASGGSFRHNPGVENPEVMEAVITYPGALVTWEQRHQSLHYDRGYGIKFHGTEGLLLVDRDSYELRPKDGEVERVTGEPEESWANPEHHNNFFDCIASRARPTVDIETGVRSTNAVLLAGIALQTGRTLHWDGAAERFIGDPQADRHLRRAYRAPWRLPA